MTAAWRRRKKTLCQHRFRPDEHTKRKQTRSSETNASVLDANFDVSLHGVTSGDSSVGGILANGDDGQPDILYCCDGDGDLSHLHESQRTYKEKTNGEST